MVAGSSKFRIFYGRHSQLPHRLRILSRINASFQNTRLLRTVASDGRVIDQPGISFHEHNARILSTILSHCRTEGYQACLDKALELKEQDAPIFNEEALRALSRELGATPDRRIRTILIGKYLVHHGYAALEPAFSLYEGMKQEGHPTIARLANSLISSTARAYMARDKEDGRLGPKRPTAQDHDHAMKVYGDWREFVASNVSLPPGEETRETRYRGRLYLGITTALTSATPPFDEATVASLCRVFNDMVRDHFRFTQMDSYPVYLFKLFRIILSGSGTPQTARTLYNALKLTDPDILDTPLCRDIFDEYLELRFADPGSWSSHITSRPPNAPRATAYISLFKYCVSVATTGNDQTRRHAFNLVSYHYKRMVQSQAPPLEIDAWNQVLAFYVYSQTPGFFGVFEDLLTNPSRPAPDDGTYAIFFDACGHHNDEARAASVWKAMMRSVAEGLRNAKDRKLPMPWTPAPNVYRSRIEGACRAGAYPTAFRIFQMMLESDGSVVPKPDVQTVAMMASFSKGTLRRAALRDLVARTIPEFSRIMEWVFDSRSHAATYTGGPSWSESKGYSSSIPLAKQMKEILREYNSKPEMWR